MCIQDHCKRFADKYIEHDYVIIFIDMLLHKPQVYRHLLFNRLDYRDRGLDVCLESRVYAYRHDVVCIAQCFQAGYSIDSL